MDSNQRSCLGGDFNPRITGLSMVAFGEPDQELLQPLVLFTLAGIFALHLKVQYTKKLSSPR